MINMITYITYYLLYSFEAIDYVHALLQSIIFYPLIGKVVIHACGKIYTNYVVS